MFRHAAEGVSMFMITLLPGCFVLRGSSEGADALY